jgi:hypothetical protein
LNSTSHLLPIWKLTPLVPYAIKALVRLAKQLG